MPRKLTVYTAKADRLRCKKPQVTASGTVFFIAKTIVPRRFPALFNAQNVGQGTEKPEYQTYKVAHPQGHYFLPTGHGFRISHPEGIMKTQKDGICHDTVTF